MAKRNRKMTDKKIERMIKEGRGQGSGADYKPWITIQDIASKGRSTRIKGIKTKRQHEFLSDMETNFFFLMEFSDRVSDIREQYPLLLLEETLFIAEKLGIKHPTDPKTRMPIVVTTDFLITIQDHNGQRLIARTIKEKQKLSKRTLDKFEIERRYWQKRGVYWGIVTEDEIDKVKANNIASIYVNSVSIFPKISVRKLPFSTENYA
ncbi:TnsA endonuclease N terminal [Peptoclostridium litorale DSM 5388]|uniref:Transposon Tn7 transposition protein TnsA n=1 Tax=Peptoclostridium litorale DSM 5388 TaxID=1121324 RepID=A0A069RBD4_PEPLI|nr:TnsA endonuclease N-terminal domain-containing protein [Peptoclostridium litorale]KDR94351.1 transposon Tn7 transposition protein TnsA [Peptoclostridium litorale DSM 5388]SIO37948.1 TnsA endonuclease N terminal [Peptoclostridium litorale DSM 5388]